MKKIYFACSIRGGRDDAELYAALIKHISSRATVLSEVFADKKLTAHGMNRPSKAIWQNDTKWIQESSVIIAEVTNPSLGVGYEIAYATNLQKPVLALYRTQKGKKLSAMIDGAPGVTVFTYAKIDEAKDAIDTFIKDLESN